MNQTVWAVILHSGSLFPFGQQSDQGSISEEEALATEIVESMDCPHAIRADNCWTVLATRGGELEQTFFLLHSIFFSLQ